MAASFLIDSKNNTYTNLSKIDDSINMPYITDLETKEFYRMVFFEYHFPKIKIGPIFFLN